MLINKIRFFLPALLWSMVIFVFSSFPTGSATNWYWSDFFIKKTAHIVEYFILTILVFRAFWNSGVDKKRALFFAFLSSIFYGITDEIHQSFTPGREPHIRDVVFDTIGAVIAVYSIWRLLPEAPQRLKNWARAFQLI